MKYGFGIVATIKLHTAKEMQTKFEFNDVRGRQKCTDTEKVVSQTNKSSTGLNTGIIAFHYTM